jgi:hypothetical protein
MDEKTGMNFSEYVAILSGNTDLLEKAKLEKQIAGLESERLSFNRSKVASKYKLEDASASLEAARSRQERMTTDWNNLQQRIQKHADGRAANPILLNGLPPGADVKQIGAMLNYLCEKFRTGGQYEAIGSLYGFSLLVKTETAKKDGVDIKDNRFFVQGEGAIKYTHNNGIMAKDPETAAMNFLKALEKLPTLIAQEEKKMAALQKDIPVLQELLSGRWAKEKTLSDFKTELAAIDRKIQLSIAPPVLQEEKTAENVLDNVEEPAVKLKMR